MQEYYQLDLNNLIATVKPQTEEGLFDLIKIYTETEDFFDCKDVILNEENIQAIAKKYTCMDENDISKPGFQKNDDEIIYTFSVVERGSSISLQTLAITIADGLVALGPSRSIGRFDDAKVC